MWKATISFMSVRPTPWNNSAPTRRIFMKLDVWAFFGNLSRKSNFYYNPKRITCTLHEDFSHLWQYLAKFFLEWEMFQIKVVEKIKTHILCPVTAFRKSCRLWDNVEKSGGVRGASNDATVWPIRVACWISKATCTHAHAQAHALGHTHGHKLTHTHTHTRTQICNTYYLSTATMIRDRFSMLRYAYIVCLVIIIKISKCLDLNELLTPVLLKMETLWTVMLCLLEGQLNLKMKTT